MASLISQYISVSLTSPTFLIPAIAIVLFTLYRLALPKPIPGIPYDKSAAAKLLGNVPALTSHIARTQGTFTTYLLETIESLNAPLIQVFIRPLSLPLVILSDFREMHDILVHRKTEFDRSKAFGELVKGMVPENHVHFKTGEAWTIQRRLVQDLMTPSFLHNVAGPVIYQQVSALIDLWAAKSSIANGRPWSARSDVTHVALDALMSFAFGERFEDSITIPMLEVLKGLDAQKVKTSKSAGDLDVPIEFPKAHVDPVLLAVMEICHLTGDVQGVPLPNLMWAYLMRKPNIKKAVKLKDDYIMQELKASVAKLESGDKMVVKSAVDQMIIREKSLAEKGGRTPGYLSRVMVDELFGFIFAGHESTSTTVCWGLKFLADQPDTQNKLRAALQSSFKAAKSEHRNPTIQEITGTAIAYLEATMEELLRCAGTAPLVEREAMVDTEVLGHKIPKGTVIGCMVLGPTMVSPGFKIDEEIRSPSSQAVKKEGRDRAWDPTDMAIFKPERWIARKETGDKFDATAGPQLAFGLGERQCYGKRLAYMEMRMLLALIIWNFELLPCPPALSGYAANLTIANEPKKCYVRLRQIAL